MSSAELSVKETDARTIAAKTLALVIHEKHTLDKVLPGMLEKLQSKKERAFAQEICYGVLRWYPRLIFIVDELLDKPLRKKDTDIVCLLLAGIYQLDYLRTPSHAAVSATVNATKTLKKDWARSFVNAVLRRYQREHAQLNKTLQTCPSAEYAHPQWLIDQLTFDWPEHWQDILKENNEHPPLHLRVNKLISNRENYLEKLTQTDINACLSDLSPVGIQITKPVDVEQLPGFMQGEVSVQDFGAQIAAQLMSLKSGQRVLDTCAAPGGKTAHIYETEPDLRELVAIELNKSRFDKLEQTLQRLKIKARLVHADAKATESWWDGNQFDRILLDVPCSASGVIRRHPDIKILREPVQIKQFTETQSRLLESIWPLLKNDGLMIYATCSVLSQENDVQIEKFSGLHKDAQIMDIMCDWGIKTRFGRQLLPTRDQSDGFYYAVIKKLNK